MRIAPKPIICEDLPRSRAQAMELGSKFYMGAPCKRGHTAPRITAKSECTECKRLQKFQRYHNDRAGNIKKVAEWAAKNREQSNATKKRWRESNIEKALVIGRKSYKKWAEKYPERVRESHRISAGNRRARLILAGGSYTTSDIERIRKLQKGKCGICRKRLSSAYDIDHIIPISKGGSNWPNNLQLLCSFCNGSKKDRDQIEYMQRRGRLL